jgi:hypothetical protein
VATSPPGADTDLDLDLDWRAVARGAIAGFSVIVPVTVLHAILDHEIRDFDDSGWRAFLYLFILGGFFAAGWLAGRLQVATPFIHGALAATGALVLWIPARVVIWAVREDDRGLVSGNDAALRPGQVFGTLVVAVAIGMLSAWIASRVADRARSSET